MTCFPANPLVCDSTDAAVSLHKVPQFHVNSTHESEPSSSFIALVIPRPRSRQYSPRRRLYRTSPTLMARDIHQCAQNRWNFSVWIWRSRLPSDPAVAVPAFAVPALVSL